MKKLTIEMYEEDGPNTRLLLDGEPLGMLLELHAFALGNAQGLKVVFADNPISVQNARKLLGFSFAEVRVQLDNSPGCLLTRDKAGTLTAVSRKLQVFYDGLSYVVAESEGEAVEANCARLDIPSDDYEFVFVPVSPEHRLGIPVNKAGDPCGVDDEDFDDIINLSCAEWIEREAPKHSGAPFYLCNEEVTGSAHCKQGKAGS